jgi:hypothetical protein
MKKVFLWVFICLFLISADKPKMAKFTLTTGVTASLPKDFVAMSDEDIAQRYPSTKKPLAMYTSLDRTVDFGLNVTKSNFGGNDLTVLQKLYKATIYDLYSNVQFSKEEIQPIGNRDFIVFEFTSEQDNVKKYTYLQYTPLGNRVYIFNFTVGAENKTKWQPVAELIMKSVHIEAKKLKESVEATQPVHKGKRPIDVIKQQKDNNPKNKKTK